MPAIALIHDCSEVQDDEASGDEPVRASVRAVLAEDDRKLRIRPSARQFCLRGVPRCREWKHAVSEQSLARKEPTLREPLDGAAVPT